MRRCAIDTIEDVPAGRASTPARRPRRLARRAKAGALLLGAGIVATACSSAPAAVQGTAHAPQGTHAGSTASRGTGSTTPTTPPTTTTPPPAQTTSQPTAPLGAPVPPGFQAGSATFVATGAGFVLGTVPCGAAVCTSLVRTEDGGVSWTSLTPPPATFVTPMQVADVTGADVTEVRFADLLDGWAWGPALYATHDGARTWQRVDLGGTVVSLETMGGFVDAVVSPCAAGTSCTGSLRLEQAPAGGGAFATVLTGPSIQSVGTDAADLSLHAPVGFVQLGEVGAHAALYATENLADAAGWHPFPDPCASVGLSLSSFDVPDLDQLYSLCSGDPAMGSTRKVAVLTVDGRGTALGDVPLGGDGGTITATPAGVLVVGSASAASFLYRSTGGGSWSTAEFYADAGTGFRDLGFTTSTQGFVVHFAPTGTGELEGGTLLVTRDAGLTWPALTIG